MTDTVKLEGSSPLTISFMDGSETVYPLDDSLLHSMVLYGDTAYELQTDGEAFAEFHWPDDVRAWVGGEELSVEALTARIVSFLVRAIQRAIENEGV